MPFIAYRYCWFFAGMVPLPNGKAGGNRGHATTKGCKLYRTHLIMWSAITLSCKREPLFSAGFGGGATTAFESSSGALMSEIICVKFTPVTGTEVYLFSSVVDPWHFRRDPDQRIVPLTNGSGSGSCYFRLGPSGRQQKTIFISEFFAYYFWRYIYIIFLR